MVFLPISLAHERNFRRTVAAYAALRVKGGAEVATPAAIGSVEGASDGIAEAGALAEPADQWPSRSLARVLGLQPTLLMTLAVLLGGMTATAIAGVLAWPHALPHFDLAINYYDRPYVWVFSSVGAALTLALAAVAVDLWRSPWARVATNLRRAIHASPERRAALFADALASDPGVTRAAGGR